MKEVKRGVVYFVTDGEAIKIGFATSLKKRMPGLQTSHHFPLFALGSIPAIKYEETVIHRRFRHLRLHGEWFQIHPEIISFIDDFEEAGQLIEGDDLVEWNRQFEPKVQMPHKITHK